MTYKNLALGTVLTAPSPATTGLSLVLNSGEGARFPDPATDGSFFVTAFPPGENPHLGNAEILEVTARSADTFTIVREQRGTTAKSIAADWIVLQGIYSEDIMGQNSFVINETPTGTVDGSNAVFTTASTFVAGSIQVYRDGQLMKGGGDDYTETDTNEITFTTAPQVDSIILVSYQISGVTTANADTVDGYHANATPTANNIPVLDATGLLPSSAINPIHSLNAPTGFLINGKIVPSVASNNLTVAIKGLDGNDPSATNPVYVRIGNTIRTIAAALSVTKNAGTNWFDSGSAHLATKEVDYFVYLGYNATDGVVIGFARIPYADLYSDFSATSTNRAYAAISTITNAAAGDEYVVVGRFAAILSATASFNWSVPTFTNKNLIQRPVFDTRILTYTPTYTNVTLGTTGLVNTGLYKISGRHIDYNTALTLGSGGDVTGDVAISFPYAPSPTGTIQIVGTGSILSGGSGYLIFHNVLNTIYYVTTTASLFGFFNATTPVNSGEGTIIIMQGRYKIVD